MSQYLHDLGVFLHFQDDPLLKKIIILKNEWATNAVYKILDSKEVIKDYGRFTYNQLDDIWDESIYENSKDELLALMLKFEICYQIPNLNTKKYLIPQLLSKDQPEYTWDASDNLIIKLRYDFLPKGLFRVFMVRLHRYIKQYEYSWRNGVLLQRDETHSQVIEKFGDRLIEVKIRGTRPKEMMTIIIEEFDNIHSKYELTSVKKMIQCNCSECKKNPDEAYFYKLEYLLKGLEKKQDKIMCHKSFEHVEIEKILNSVFIKKTNHQKICLDLLKSGDIGKVFHYMENHQIYKSDNEHLHLIFQYNHNYKQFRAGLIPQGEYTLELNKISKTLIDKILHIKEETI